MKNWISAFRLRTLPLALSSILMGNFLAHWSGVFSWAICLLTLLTTIFLQILSNLANDYGDSIHGADSDDREGPKRAVQAGLITSAQMKKAVVFFAVLSLLSGVGLLATAFSDQWVLISAFLIVGLLAIYAAISYTAGKNPYGYAGFGDVSVFIFFGLVGVMGSYFVQTGDFDLGILFPAISCGLLSTGVLNVNNIRDIESDRKAGKLSIPVRIGRDNAVKYHVFLVVMALVFASIFVYVNYTHWYQPLFLLSLPFFWVNLRAVITKSTAETLDPYLKQLALSTLLFVVLFGLGHIF